MPRMSIFLSFRRWYSQSGTPIVSVRDDYNPELEQYTLHVTQHTPITADQKEKLPLHIPLDIELYDNEGKVIPLQHNGSSGASRAERHRRVPELCVLITSISSRCRRCCASFFRAGEARL